MALPVSISGLANAATTSGWGNIGPFLINGNVYVFGTGASGAKNGVLEVYKATDPTSSFTEQDSSNRPDLGIIGDVTYMDCYQSGSNVHIMFTYSGITSYALFDASTDTWQDVGGSNNFYTVYSPTAGPTTAWGGITLRSDGDIIIVHPGENPTSKGGEYQEVAYSRYESGSGWSSGVVVASSGTKNQNYLYAYPVMGSSDQCHFGYIFDNDADFYLRALSSGNSLRTQRTSASSFGRVKKGVDYTRSSTEKIAFYVTYSALSQAVAKVYFTHFTDDTSPSFTVETITSPDFDDTIPHFQAGYAVDINVANQDNYAGYINPDNSDIYLKGDDGGTSWSDQNSSTAIRAGTVTGISANIYERAGYRVYAFVYDDNGTIKYDEFQLYTTVDTDDLGTPSGISSSGFVGTPAITQLHTISTSGVSSSPFLGSLTLSQLHNLTATAISSSGFVGIPALTLMYDLGTPDGITSSPFIGALTLAQIHVLTTSDVSSSGFVETPAITQLHDLTATSISSSGFVDNPSLATIFNLTADGISSSPFVDTPTISATYSFSTSGVSSSPFVGNPELTIPEMDMGVRVRWTGNPGSTTILHAVTTSQLRITK